MKVAIRVDASIMIGTGHVMRCRTLANVLRQYGAEVIFIMRDHKGHLKSLILNDDYKIIFLKKPFKKYSGNSKYAEWLGVSQELDAQETIEGLKSISCDWIIVDHYGIDENWEKLIRHHCKKIMVIDDLFNRRHDCDLLLDQNYCRNYELRYKEKIPQDCKLLIGPRFTLLSNEYLKKRLIQQQKKLISINRLLVYVGGSDNDNVTEKILKALSLNELKNLEVDLVIGKNFQFRESLIKKAKARNRTNIYENLDSLASLIMQADAAIGAGGGSLWERMCLGLPSFVISIAENQIPGCLALNDAGLIYYMGEGKEIEITNIAFNISKYLSKINEVNKMIFSNQILVDGRGTERVILALKSINQVNLQIRTAKIEDLQTYFDWANDPVVRQNAINTEPIDFEVHLNWFENKIQESNCALFVMLADNLPIGQVRFEFANGVASIDYSIEKFMRGLGLASWLVERAIDKLDKSLVHEVRALVKISNKASINVFNKLRFEVDHNNSTSELICFKKLIKNDGDLKSIDGKELQIV
jgi:UDP-2,4-diacetamido-2,4,6-trideoxy-beta-L-altropyranose hydrolase